MRKKIATMAVVLMASTVASAFAPPSPLNANENNAIQRNSEERKGAAPIGTGTLLLLALGAGYTGVAVYRNKSHSKENDDK